MKPVSDRYKLNAAYKNRHLKKANDEVNGCITFIGKTLATRVYWKFHGSKAMRPLASGLSSRGNDHVLKHIVNVKN